MLGLGGMMHEHCTPGPTHPFKPAAVQAALPLPPTLTPSSPCHTCLSS